MVKFRCAAACIAVSPRRSTALTSAPWAIAVRTAAITLRSSSSGSRNALLKKRPRLAGPRAAASRGGTKPPATWGGPTPPARSKTGRQRSSVVSLGSAPASASSRMTPASWNHAASQ